MSESSHERAPMGGPAESEVPYHDVPRDREDRADARGAGEGEGEPVEDSATYELAVEDGAPLPADGQDPGAGEAAPQFLEPGADDR